MAEIGICHCSPEMSTSFGLRGECYAEFTVESPGLQPFKPHRQWRKSTRIIGNTIDPAREVFRRRLGLPAEVLEHANEVGPAGEPPRQPAPRTNAQPVPRHRRGTGLPHRLGMGNHGTAGMGCVTGQLAICKHSWRRSGRGVSRGYGAVVTNTRLKSWIAYHSAMMMLEAAENRDGKLPAMAPMVRSRGCGRLQLSGKSTNLEAPLRTLLAERGGSHAGSIAGGHCNVWTLCPSPRSTTFARFGSPIDL